MNSTRAFYNFLIFVILIFVFLVFLPQKVFAGCTRIYRNCGACVGNECYGCTTCWENSTRRWCQQCASGCYESFECDCFSSPCGGCFVGGTEIEVRESENSEYSDNSETKEIKDLQPGEIVSSFNPETGEISESQVAEVHKITREGYYELETESGKKVKVTGEHPFLAIKANNFQFPISNFQLIDELKNVLSNTLTFRLITGLQTKLIEILD